MNYFVDAYENEDADTCRIGDVHELAADLLEAWCKFDRFVEGGKFPVVTLWEYAGWGILELKRWRSAE